MQFIKTNLEISRQNLFYLQEKAAAKKLDAVPLGLLTYPVLQAADILLYK